MNSKVSLSLEIEKVKSSAVWGLILLFTVCIRLRGPLISREVLYRFPSGLLHLKVLLLRTVLKQENFGGN